MSTFLLVPGAGGDGFYWHRVVAELETRGHEAIAVTLPAENDSAGWNEYADAIVEAAADRKRLIVVAQSFGGFSATLACERLDVALLVLVNAMIPTSGESGGGWWSNTNQGPEMAGYLESIGLTRADAREDRVLYFHDVPPHVTDEVFARGEPDQSGTPLEQVWPLDRWPDVPTRVIAGRDDRLFPAEFQRRVARERLGVEADVIEGGHLLALSRPTELVDQLEAYLRSTAA
jgi:pimeloyl-ACP methyl ester carboxylesterase